MKGFLAIVGVLALLATAFELLQATRVADGPGGGLASFMTEGHVIEWAILMVVSFLGAGVMDTIQTIAKKLDAIAEAVAPPKVAGEKSTPTDRRGFWAP